MPSLCSARDSLLLHSLWTIGVRARFGGVHSGAAAIAVLVCAGTLGVTPLLIQWQGAR